MKHMTYGELHSALMNVDKREYIQFDFGGFSPDAFHSYRGIYSDYGLDYKKESVSVGDFLKVLNRYENSELQGWKGGDFQMTDNTIVWVSEDGYASGTALVGVFVPDIGNVILQTRHRSELSSTNF